MSELAKLNTAFEGMPFLTFKGELIIPTRWLGMALDYGNDGQVLSDTISGYWKDEFGPEETFIIKGHNLSEFKKLTDGTGLYQVPPKVSSMSVLTEPGVYIVMQKSEKAKCKPFRHFLAHQVLPEIRKTGSFGSNKPQELLSKTAIKDLGSLLLRLERLPGVFRKQLGGLTAMDQETIRSKIRWVLTQVPDGPVADLSKLLTSSESLSDEALAQLPWFPPIGRTWKEDFQAVYPYYRTTEQFKARKRLLFKQYPNCVDCKVAAATEPHHVTYKNLVKNGMESAGDMVSLCSSCHKKRTGDKAQKELFDLVKQPVQAPQPAPQF